MKACFDAFAAERRLKGIIEPFWAQCTDTLAACAVGEHDGVMCSFLCEHVLLEGEIIVTELQARPELNGFVASIIGSMADGRIPVQVRNAERTRVRLRVPNLRPIGSSAAQPSRHTVRTVHDGDYSFLYTVGASAIETRGREFRRELFVRDVPEGKTAAVARLLNLLVWRVEDGHLVTEPQYCQCSGLQMEIAIHLAAPARDLSDAYDLSLPNRNELIELIPLVPVQPMDTHEMWARVPTLADQARMGVGKQEAGMPQSLSHQGDILPWHIARAVEAGDEATISKYLQDGGYVNARLPSEATGLTLLMLASRAGQLRMVVLLLARGAEPNLRHAFGGTALMGAAEMGITAVIDRLLRARADPRLVDNDGWTAIDFVEKPTDAFSGTLTEFAERNAAAADLLRPHSGGAQSRTPAADSHHHRPKSRDEPDRITDLLAKMGANAFSQSVSASAPLNVGPSVPDEKVLLLLQRAVPDERWASAPAHIHKLLLEAGITGVSDKRLKRLKKLKAAERGTDGTPTADDALILAVRAQKLKTPSATANEVREALAAEGKEFGISEVKQACSKVTKALAQEQASSFSAEPIQSTDPKDVEADQSTARKLWDDQCAWCGTQPTVSPSGLQSCSRCLLVRYCSAECQRAAWKAGHKRSCGLGPPTLTSVTVGTAAALLSEFGAADATIAVEAMLKLSISLTQDEHRPPNLAAATPVLDSLLRAAAAHPQCIDIHVFAVTALVYLLVSNDQLTDSLTDFGAEAQMRTARTLRVSIDCFCAPSGQTHHAHSRAPKPIDERRGFADAVARVVMILLQYITWSDDDVRSPPCAGDSPADALERRRILLEGDGARHILELIHLSFSGCKRTASEADKKQIAMWALFFLTVNTQPIMTKEEYNLLLNPCHPATIAAQLGFYDLIIEACKFHHCDEQLTDAGRACLRPENAFALACLAFGKLDGSRHSMPASIPVCLD